LQRCHFRDQRGFRDISNCRYKKVATNVSEFQLGSDIVLHCLFKNLNGCYHVINGKAEVCTDYFFVSVFSARFYPGSYFPKISINFRYMLKIPQGFIVETLFPVISNKLSSYSLVPKLYGIYIPKPCVLIFFS
jgi:D-arabinose 1-dehydrogenase-like Zn-dependent alcohol dehydrogenase